VSQISGSNASNKGYVRSLRLRGGRFGIGVARGGEGADSLFI